MFFGFVSTRRPEDRSNGVDDSGGMLRTIANTRLLDGARHNRDWPRFHELLILFGAVWFGAYVFLRMVELSYAAYALAARQHAWFPFERIPTFELLKEGDQRLFFVGAILSLCGVVYTLLGLFPATRNLRNSGDSESIESMRNEVSSLQANVAGLTKDKSLLEQTARRYRAERDEKIGKIKDLDSELKAITDYQQTLEVALAKGVSNMELALARNGSHSDPGVQEALEQLKKSRPR